MDLIFEMNQVRCLGNLYYESIVIPRNQVTWVRGESGSGKSTLLKLLNGTIQKEAGQIKFNGDDLESLSPTDLRRKVLLISQSVFLFDRSIRENFNLFYEYRALQPPLDDRINRFLELCEIPIPLDRSCELLSGGERQRVYLALFLSFQPEVVLLDEPTSALDTDTSERLLNKIVEHCKTNQMTLVVVSHDPTLGRQHADQWIDVKKE